MGYLRFSLTIAVLTSHLIYHGWQGRTAVFGFYILSGFLITLISNEIYNHGWKGKLYFLSNRFIRIYPAYWACVPISLLCIYVTHSTLTSYTPGMAVPATWQQWLPNLAIFGLNNNKPDSFKPYLVPTGWCLATELVYYLILGLHSACSKRLSMMYFIASLGITGTMIANHDTAVHIYFMIYGPAPLFFLGSLLYHYREALKPFCIRQPVVLLCIANLALYGTLTGGFSKAHPQWEIFGLFGAGIPLAYTIVSFYHYERLKGISKKEQFLADISYPMFLLHMQVSRAACWLITGRYRLGWDVFAFGLVTTFILSCAIVFAIEIPLKRYRSILRLRATALPATGMVAMAV